MNYFIHTYGCQMNVHESEKIAGVLSKLGYTENTDIKKADIIVFNTCCIRETAESKIYGNLGQVKKLKKDNPKLIIVMCGCMVQQDDTPAKIKSKYPYVDIVLGTTNLHQLEDAIVNAQKEKYKLYDTEFANQLDYNLPVYRTSYPNAWVNIIYGCNNFCTYCIVPYVRGREKSREINSIITEVKELLQQGYKEITLLGQNVNSYGNDLDDDTNFAKLLNEIGKIEGKFRIRFMTSHPKDLTDSVIDAIANNNNVCNYIHLPIQSGNNAVLQDMNRRYTREHYLELLQKIRTKMPDAGLTTDIMVGFPTETEECFLDTLSLVEQADFSSTFSFIYSPRSGTPASTMPQLDYKTKQNRISRLIATQNKKTKELSNKMIGCTYEVLIDDFNAKNNKYVGRTENGRLVNIDSDADIIGQFVNVLITTAKSASLYGKIVL